jgi:predicted nucleotide-binding protein
MRPPSEPNWQWLLQSRKQHCDSLLYRAKFSEQYSRTIIEKVEANSDVGFAIVLLTPDDEGKARNSI